MVPLSTNGRTSSTRRANARSWLCCRASILRAKTAPYATCSTKRDHSVSRSPPSAPLVREELAHDFLWRAHVACPRRGFIGIFNRSHYEDVLVGRVRELAPKKVIEQRYEQINAFERMLVENGTTVLKFMLHISKEEQRERLQARLDEPESRWKFNPGDLEDRKRWDEYEAAYELMLNRCSTEWAPWHVIPSGSQMGAQCCSRLHRARDVGSNGPAISKSGLEAERLQSGVRGPIRGTV